MDLLPIEFLKLINFGYFVVFEQLESKHNPSFFYPTTITLTFKEDMTSLVFDTFPNLQRFSWISSNCIKSISSIL